MLNIINACDISDNKPECNLDLDGCDFRVPDPEDGHCEYCEDGHCLNVNAIDAAIKDESAFMRRHRWMCNHNLEWCGNRWEKKDPEPEFEGTINLVDEVNKMLAGLAEGPR